MAISYEDPMPTRREFLQQAAILSSAAAWSGAFPAAIAKALTIDPEPGSTFLDAEHVVILMQENRSFDHAFGTLQGVRGFNDPRAITLPNGNPVWVQTNRRGESYAPFRLNIKDSNATWLGCLPHGRTDQVDARNGGRYDRWLTPSDRADGYADMPFTLGYYTREDIPFYYALADAFTICDQHFCSALTCTTPNRLFLWTGTVREKQTADSPAKLNNEEAVYDAEVSWTTFPERLEDHGISWKVYQNEMWLASGLEDEHDAWLANFGDNPLEYFTQYNVRFAEQHRRHLDEQRKELAGRNQGAPAKDRGQGSCRPPMKIRSKSNSPRRSPPCSKSSRNARGGPPRTTRSSRRARRASTRRRSRPTPPIPIIASWRRIPTTMAANSATCTCPKATCSTRSARTSAPDNCRPFLAGRPGAFLRPSRLGLVRRVVHRRGDEHPDE